MAKETVKTTMYLEKNESCRNQLLKGKKRKKNLKKKATLKDFNTKLVIISSNFPDFFFFFRK